MRRPATRFRLARSISSRICFSLGGICRGRLFCERRSPCCTFASTSAQLVRGPIGGVVAPTPVVPGVVARAFVRVNERRRCGFKALRGGGLPEDRRVTI